MNLLKKKQQNQAQSQKGQSQKQAPQPKERKSPNLLQTAIQSKTKDDEKHQFRVSKSAFFLILLIQVIFIFLSLFNSRTIAQIEQTQKNIRKLETNVLSNRLKEEKIRDVLARTDELKRIEQERILLEPKVSGFINELPDGVVLVRSFIKQDKMTLTVETKTAIEISLLISSYFDQGFAQEIVILTANLNKSKDVFVTTLEIIY